MPTIDLTDEEHTAVTAAVRRSIAEDKYSLSPRLAPLKAALVKLASVAVTQPRPPLPPLPQAGPSRGSRRARR